MSSLPSEERYTYADYYSWDDGKRWELYEGVPVAMSPSPTRFHQRLNVNLVTQINNYLRGKPCEVFTAPFDVRLNPNDEDNTVVQPDIFVVCDKSKLDEKCCKGAPDLIVEILSPSSKKHDLFDKMRLYRQAGVREYWIVDPELSLVNVHILQNGEYIVRTYGESDEVAVTVIEGLVIRLADVFEFE